MEARSEPVLPPGFRFHPTDEELIVCYLIKKVEKNNFSVRAIGDVDLNKSEPWELPEKAKMGEKEWYFFTLRDRKYPTGMRTNRATEAGYWKATGKDRDITRSGSTALVGAKKTLVFYRGRAPKGVKTNWIMHEYRLEGEAAYLHNCRTSKESEWVVCRIFQKSPGGKKAMYRDSNGGRTKSSFCDDVDTHSSLPPLLESPPFTGNDDSGAEAAESALRGSSDHQINSFPMFHEKQPFSSLTQQLAGWSSGIVRGESSNMATNMNSPQAVLDAGNAFRFPALSCYDSYYDMSGASNALMAKLRQDLEIPTTRPGTAGGNAARSCKMEPPSYMDQQQPFPSNYSSGHGSLDNWVNESLGFEQQTTTTNNNNNTNNSSSSFSESGLREILDSSNSSGLYRTGSSVDLEESFWPY